MKKITRELLNEMIQAIKEGPHKKEYVRAVIRTCVSKNDIVPSEYVDTFAKIAKLVQAL